jgi:hypothetical protein
MAPAAVIFGIAVQEEHGLAAPYVHVMHACAIHGDLERASQIWTRQVAVPRAGLG